MPLQEKSRRVPQGLYVLNDFFSFYISVFQFPFKKPIRLPPDRPRAEPVRQCSCIFLTSHCPSQVRSGLLLPPSVKGGTPTAFHQRFSTCSFQSLKVLAHEVSDFAVSRRKCLHTATPTLFAFMPCYACTPSDSAVVSASEAHNYCITTTSQIISGNKSAPTFAFHFTRLNDYRTGINRQTLQMINWE